MLGQAAQRRDIRFSAEAPDRSFGIVAVAASLGGVSALGALLYGLPADFPLPVLVCQHLSREGRSVLPRILARRTELRVPAAEEGEAPAAGHVHVAPPNRHLVVRPDGRLGLGMGERVNFCRPSADVLFRSVAEAHGARAIGVVLTGRSQDGARGVREIRRRGGFAIAQDEASSEAFHMPLAARDIGQADLVLPLHRIAPALQVLAAPPAAEQALAGSGGEGRTTAAHVGFA